MKRKKSTHMNETEQNLSVQIPEINQGTTISASKRRKRTEARQRWKAQRGKVERVGKTGSLEGWAGNNKRGRGGRGRKSGIQFIELREIFRFLLLSHHQFDHQT